MDTSLGASYPIARDTTPDVLPASQYLQDKLQQRRARSSRPIRSRQSDVGPRRARDDDIFFNEAQSSKNEPLLRYESSPLAAGQQESGHGIRKRTMGLKGMDEHMDRLTKENFALKLELDHRRHHTVTLQDKIEAMRAQLERTEQLQAEHAELLRINSQLVEEMEKRDRAVEEAMDIICDLEDRVNDFEERHSLTRPSTANPDSGYAGTETHEHAPDPSPPKQNKASTTPHEVPGPSPVATSAATARLLGAVGGETPLRSRREPSVLSQTKQSTHALRSVYLEATQSLHPVKSFNSLLTRQEERDGEDETPNSPRLSVLSESSFPSLYSPKKAISPSLHAWEAESDDPNAPSHRTSPHLRQDSIKRVSQWMREKDFPEDTPSKSKPFTSILSSQLDNKDSLIAQEHLTPVVSLSIDPNVANAVSLNIPANAEHIRSLAMQPQTGSSKAFRPTTFGGAMFGEPLLPPTPESASTRILRAAHSSVEDERSPLDVGPCATSGFNALGFDVRTAPQQMRSSIELNNAYQSYVHHREEIDDDAVSDTVHDFSIEYDGFPDGGSIIMGTPSRFLKHGMPPAPASPSDGYELSPIMVTQASLTRRQSISKATTSQRKPSLSRAATSPSLPRGQAELTMTSLHSSSATLTSPRSYHSGSSSNKTIRSPEDRMLNISPELYRNGPHPSTAVDSHRSRTSPSPARRLSQKAHGFLRRMSNTQRDVSNERGKAPLPTLTTSPSSAYVNVIPKEARRPGTGYSVADASGQLAGAPPRMADRHRPTMQMRVNTSPSDVRRRESAGVSTRPSLEVERKNLFQRSNSAHGGDEGTVQNDSTSTLREGGGMRGMLTRRRDSIKDAVSSAARRPWR